MACRRAVTSRPLTRRNVVYFHSSAGGPEFLLTPISPSRAAPSFTQRPNPAVFERCLAIVIRLRETLPVVPIPEELHVAAVRNDVIHNLCQIHHSVVRLEVVYCDRMCLQVQ